MAGYSGTPLPQKLGIKAQGRVATVRAPDGFAATLGALPDGVAPLSLAKASSLPASKAFDVIICFVRSLDELDRELPTLKKRLHHAGGLWIAWPKKSAAKKLVPPTVPSIGENDIRSRGLAGGLVDNKVCAIDEVWSGLRFVFRLSDRPRTAS